MQYEYEYEDKVADPANSIVFELPYPGKWNPVGSLKARTMPEAISQFRAGALCVSKR